jgi:ABC-type multidrug transport system ATPase subunit
MPKTEHKIVDNLNNFLQNKTTIIIPHRIFLSIKFDKIIILSEGEIVESGTHATLLAQEGYYADLYNLQLREEKLQRKFKKFVKILVIVKQYYICCFKKHYIIKPNEKWLTKTTTRKWKAFIVNALKQGKEELIFFDVRATRANDYYLTITESRKRFNDGGVRPAQIILI